MWLLDVAVVVLLAIICLILWRFVVKLNGGKAE